MRTMSIEERIKAVYGEKTLKEIFGLTDEDTWLKDFEFSDLDLSVRAFNTIKRSFVYSDPAKPLDEVTDFTAVFIGTRRNVGSEGFNDFMSKLYEFIKLQDAKTGKERSMLYNPESSI